MSEREQIAMLAREIERLRNRYVAAFERSNSAFIGVLPKAILETYDIAKSHDECDEE